MEVQMRSGITGLQEGDGRVLGDIRRSGVCDLNAVVVNVVGNTRRK
jgi:hypothetical protein